VIESIRLLHVDDDPEFTDLTAEFIDREFDEFDIIQAADAEEGLETLESEPIDCIVSDYKLPGRDGIEFLREVREIDRDLPFILFTGKGSESVASEAISSGATDYFRKERIEDQYDLLANRVLNAVSATQARERVRNRTREYRMLVEEAPVPMLVVGDSHEIRYANAYAIDTLGAESDGGLTGETVERFLPSDDDAALDRLDTVLNDRTPVEFTEYKFQDLHGNTRHGRGTIVPVAFSGEAAAQLIVSDITERKRQEKAVQRHRAQITELHQIGVDIAGCESKQEVYQLMVDAAERILDFDLCVADSVEDGGLVVEATSSELSEYMEPPVEEAGLAGKAYQSGESSLVNDSTDHPVANPVDDFRSVLTVPIADVGVFQAAAREVGAFDEQDLELAELLVGHASQTLVRLEQQERLREQRDQLRRENERLDQFASIVSHDIRNPLNVAQLRLDLAMDECESEHLEAVERSVERMETLTDELLSLARMGDSVTELSPVELSTVTSDCWHNVETTSATLSVPSEGQIQAAETRLQQLIENLLRNAVEHGGEDVIVTVDFLDDGDGFYVEDDGEGMTDEVREQALESGFSTQEGGTGFGLAIVARAAEAHGWDLTVGKSESGGARFEFTGVDII
jgi:PAS domain S-box-containing protein